MEIVTGVAAPRQEPDVARDTLFEMAAVIRTIFGAGAQAPVRQPASAYTEGVPPDPIAPPAPLAAVPAPTIPAPAVAVPPVPVPEVVALHVPDLPDAPALAVPRTPVPEVATAAIPVPSIPVPAVAPENSQDHDSPAERHSLALLQEIAFLDD